MATETGEFYEDDEPIEDVLAAWERSPKGVTAPAQHGVNMVLEIGGGVRLADVGETALVSSRPGRQVSWPYAATPAH